MTGGKEGRFYVAQSTADAVAALADRGRNGAVLAGATWIMRAPIREEPLDSSYVAISKIEELRRLDIQDHEIAIGASVTHAELANALARLPEYRVLAQAAGNSANAAIRQVATIGGNLCASTFPAADLPSALLVLNAEVDLETPRGTERLALDRFLTVRADLEPGCLLRRVIVPRRLRHSVHVRLPLRKAGDYPVSIVSFATAFGPDGMVSDAAIAVGSVEAAARRWPQLEAALTGHRLDPSHAAEMAERYCGDFQGRDGIEAPGWYRVKVLPTLVRRAVEALQIQM